MEIYCHELQLCCHIPYTNIIQSKCHCSEPHCCICCVSVLQWSCYSSHYSSRGNMLSTPLPLALSALSVCLSHFFIAHGLREQLAFWMLFPLCEHTLIGSQLPQKQSSMVYQQPVFCWFCSKKKNKKKSLREKMRWGKCQEVSPQPV